VRQFISDKLKVKSFSQRVLEARVNIIDRYAGYLFFSARQLVKLKLYLNERDKDRLISAVKLIMIYWKVMLIFATRLHFALN